MSNGKTGDSSDDVKSVNDKGSNIDGQPTSPEALLMDDSTSRTIAAIAADEVRVVKVKKSGKPISIILLLILTIIAVAGGYYYLQQLTPVVTTVAKVKPTAPVRMVVPERVAVDSDKVEEEIIRSEKIAVSVDSGTAGAIGTLDQKNIAAIKPKIFTIEVGPFIHSDDVKQATKKLQELGFQPQVNRGKGPVTMVRLLEGVYSIAEAETRYLFLKQSIKSTFTLPENDKKAVYVGSFHQQWRAKSLQDDLAAKNIVVKLVPISVVMDGTMLKVLQADKRTASEVMAHIIDLGYSVRLEEKE